MASAFLVSAHGNPVPESPRSRAAIQTHESLLRQAMKDQGLELGDPVFVRIVKSSDTAGYLEVYVETDEVGFKLFRTWNICTFSGMLGPKMKTDDRQAPEGFYSVKPAAMNPNSSYHLSFNLGYPNAYDRAHGRTGSFLMVHGDCVSIGCYAMTDIGIEEIYTIMDAAFKSGQSFIRAHVFPFEMTSLNMERHRSSQHYAFWQNLGEGWDWFERESRPPNVEIRGKSYIFSESELDKAGPSIRERN